MASKDWTASFFDQDYVELLQAQKSARSTQAQVAFVCDVLEIRPPVRVLDVACGFGRHAIELAKRGFDVVGVDQSPMMIRQARRAARGIGHVTFQRADMRRLAFDGEFDAAINMFTSFGYFSHTDNLRTLRRIARAVRPGGKVLVDHRDRDFGTSMHGRRGNQYKEWWPIGDTRFVLEEVNFDPATGINTNRWHIMIRDGKRYRLITRPIRLQVYSKKQWDAMLRSCGLHRRAAYADFDGTRHRRGHGRRLILVAQKGRPSPSKRWGSK